MTKNKWKDATGYSQGEDKKKVKPRAYRLGDDHVTSVLVHRHIDDPGTWFVSCIGLYVSKVDLETVDIDEAKVKALEYVADKATRLCILYTSMYNREQS